MFFNTSFSLDGKGPKGQVCPKADDGRELHQVLSSCGPSPCSQSAAGPVFRPAWFGLIYRIYAKPVQFYGPENAAPLLAALPLLGRRRFRRTPSTDRVFPLERVATEF